MPLPVMRMLANLALDGFVGAAPRMADAFDVIGPSPRHSGEGSRPRSPLVLSPYTSAL
ncbi:MAG: hypothetical protein ACM30D_14615 [Hyphomicrobiales bacterium]|jgi:hypothetical protein|nr:hypothetical protein [Xanthobacteraceae bacterium]